jgi:hypothetical protein
MGEFFPGGGDPSIAASKVDRVGDSGIVLAAGGTAPGTAPLKLTEQPAALTIVEPGAFELVGHSLQFSQFLNRRGVAMSQNVRVTDTTIANTITESSALLTAEHGVDYLDVGKSEEMVLRGYISQRSNVSAFGTFRVKYAGVTIQSLVTPANTTMNNVPFELRVTFTCRSTGSTGTARIDALMITGAAISLDPGAGSLIVLDTTTAQDTTVTFQWNESNASNTVTFTQGRVLCLDQNR